AYQEHIAAEAAADLDCVNSARSTRWAMLKAYSESCRMAGRCRGGRVALSDHSEVTCKKVPMAHPPINPRTELPAVVTGQAMLMQIVEVLLSARAGLLIQFIKPKRAGNHCRTQEQGTPALFDRKSITQNEPNAEPRLITTASAIMAPTMPTI